MKRTLWIPAGIIFLAAAVSLAEAPQDKEKPALKADGAPKSMMQCPMMASMQGMKMFADSPAVLLAEAEDLGLTDEQKKQLKEIEESARQKATAVLTVKQQEKLKESPKEPLSMMDLCMMRMKKMIGQKEEKGRMCPMCMKMMQETAQSEEKEHKGKHHKEDHDEK